jgi:hypothetical protein
MDHACQTYTTQQENFKKMLHKCGKSGILIVPIELARPDGVVTFNEQVVQGKHPLLFALSTAESLSCPKSIGSIGGLTIFQRQQYSSCTKAGGCRAAQLLGGFRRNLLIVSWATPTPECTANFPGN